MMRKQKYDYSGFSPGVKAAVAVFALLVCVAVCFVKQHSFVDVLAALPMCLLAEVIVYGKDKRFPKRKKRVPSVGKA